MTNQPETAVTVDALARMLSAADVEINHGDYPTWDTLAESGQKQYRQAARYLLKRLHITAPAAVSAAVAPPTQAAPSLRAGLRDEIVKALGRITTVPPVAHRREQADHVLAVLYREWPWLRAEAEDAEPTDRAAVLREAADRAEVVALRLRLKHDTGAANGAYEVMDELRRMADETATETPETPTVAWHILTHQRGTWRPWLAPRDNSTEAREDYDRCVSDNGHRWAFRLVRETSTFTVESEHQPAAGARQDGAET